MPLSLRAALSCVQVGISPFSDLELDDMRRVAEALEPVEVFKDEVVMRMGEMGTAMRVTQRNTQPQQHTPQHAFASAVVVPLPSRRAPAVPRRSRPPPPR